MSRRNEIKRFAKTSAIDSKSKDLQIHRQDNNKVYNFKNQALEQTLKQRSFRSKAKTTVQF